MMALFVHAFLSTPSARRATGLADRDESRQLISIHALREEGDCSDTLSRASRRRFLSTPSARRATKITRALTSTTDISIHALREEGDVFFNPIKPFADKFLSTPSARRATGFTTQITHSIMNFYPRPPRGGRRHYLIYPLLAV